MSHRALQHALVIAQFDEDFARHLDALDLDPRERAQLAAVDPRAFRTDPLRRRRTLRALAEELKVSLTLALAETRSLAFAEAFFASPEFRAAVIGRAPLAPALGAYLAAAVYAGRLRTPQLASVVHLETTLACCRRDKDAPPVPGLALAPGVDVARFDDDVLETMNRVETWLFELGLMPQVALCDDRPPLPALPAPAPGAGPLFLLFTPTASGVGLTTIDAQLYHALDALRDPTRRAGVRSELVDSLVAEGLLTRGA